MSKDILLLLKKSLPDDNIVCIDNRLDSAKWMLYKPADLIKCRRSVIANLLAFGRAGMTCFRGMTMCSCQEFHKNVFNDQECYIIYLTARMRYLLQNKGIPYILDVQCHSMVRSNYRRLSDILRLGQKRDLLVQFCWQSFENKSA